MMQKCKKMVLSFINVSIIVTVVSSAIIASSRGFFDQAKIESNVPFQKIPQIWNTPNNFLIYGYSMMLVYVLCGLVCANKSIVSSFIEMVLFIVFLVIWIYLMCVYCSNDKRGMLPMMKLSWNMGVFYPLLVIIYYVLIITQNKDNHFVGKMNNNKVGQNEMGKSKEEKTK